MDTETLLLRVIVQLAVIIKAARVSGNLFRRIGQPAVCGEIAAGLLIGPSLFGRLFPALFTGRIMIELNITRLDHPRAGDRHRAVHRTRIGSLTMAAAAVNDAIRPREIGRDDRRSDPLRAGYGVHGPSGGGPPEHVDAT